MSQVRVVTDSAAYIPQETIERLGIRVVSHNIYWDHTPFRDEIDLSREEFFHRLRTEGTSLRVEPPSIADFRRVYAELTQETDSILSIHVSGRLSRACQIASRAAEIFLGRCHITIVDSLTSSMGLGILATTAAQAGAAGRSLEQVTHLMRGMIPHIYSVFFTEDLEYLERGGRISRTQSLLGSMLGIKPFLTVEEGDIIPIEKVTTRERIIDKLVEFVEEFSSIEQLAIVQHSPEPLEETQVLIERLRMLLPMEEIPVILYDPVLAYHIGPNSLGMIIYEGL